MDPIDNLASLLAITRQGGKPKYLLFWGHTPATPDAIDKSCFSQWYPASFAVDGFSYATAEHYMMAQKAELFGDAVVAERIRAARTPGEAKALGRQVRGFDEARWLAERFELVVRGNAAKFSQQAACRDFLLATGERVLVEASPLDPIWGIGLAAEHPHSQNPAQWQGLNLLGFALMRVRQMLREA